MTVSTGVTLGALARGTFGPALDQIIPEEALSALRNDQFIKVTDQGVVGGCGDERLDTDGSRIPLPPVFGGLFSAVIADALGMRLWYRKGMTMQEHALLMTKELQRIQPTAKLCVHTDEHNVSGAECGCAAIAKASAVVAMLLDPEYQPLVDERYRDQIVQNATELLDNGYFQAGTTHFVDELERNHVAKEVLAGNHTGIAVMVNDDQGTFYDRPAFYKWCEEKGFDVVTFFEYSRWAMRETARLLGPTQDARDLFFVAGDVFNRLVPYAICNPDTLVLERTNQVIA